MKKQILSIRNEVTEYNEKTFGTTKSVSYVVSTEQTKKAAIVGNHTNFDVQKMQGKVSKSEKTLHFGQKHTGNAINK